MASDVDICNLALSNLGDRATVSSINPPEASAQAELCARFYPVMRDMMLELHPWAFATTETTLAQLATPVYGWVYSYTQPSDLLKPIEILFNPVLGQSSDLQPACLNEWNSWTPNRRVDFVRETDSLGNYIICTNQPNAVLRYVRRVEDTSKFSALFVDALSWRLSAALAGPLIKGDAGASQSARCMQVFQSLLNQAKVADSQSRSVKPVHKPSWVRGR